MIHSYKCPGEIISAFDIDCCALLFNGSQVYGVERAVRSLETGCNVIDAHCLTFSMSRARKYASRGFRTVKPCYLFTNVCHDSAVLYGLPKQELIFSHISPALSDILTPCRTVYQPYQYGFIFYYSKNRCMVALACGSHNRLGMSSPVRLLSNVQLQRIHRYLQPVATRYPANADTVLQRLPIPFYGLCTPVLPGYPGLYLPSFSAHNTGALFLKHKVWLKSLPRHFMSVWDLPKLLTEKPNSIPWTDPLKLPYLLLEKELPVLHQIVYTEASSRYLPFVRETHAVNLSLFSCQGALCFPFRENPYSASCSFFLSQGQHPSTISTLEEITVALPNTDLHNDLDLHIRISIVPNNLSETVHQIHVCFVAVIHHPDHPDNPVCCVDGSAEMHAQGHSYEVSHIFKATMHSTQLQPSLSVSVHTVFIIVLP
ncbi:hypothetical protein Pelo_7691 [Pelomyxa schiedti]|nr:hypothetical protein Pelo_7691 [Pelomyxa schiedti]